MAIYAIGRQQALHEWYMIDTVDRPGRTNGITPVLILGPKQYICGAGSSSYPIFLSPSL